MWLINELCFFQFPQSHCSMGISKQHVISSFSSIGTKQPQLLKEYDSILFSVNCE